MTTAFALVRSFGGYSEPVAGTSGVSAVYLNGAAQAGGSWSVSSGYAPTILFASAPPAGALVTADFGALLLCRFVEDVADLENFMSLLWSFRTVRMATVRP